MLEWINAHQAMLWWLGLFSVITFMCTLTLTPIIVTCIPADYFDHRRRSPTRRKEQNQAIRLTLLLGKNLLALTLIAGGIAMLFLPGQGLLTILIGVMLLDFPGKYVLERRIVQQPKVLHTINWLRAKSNRPPLHIPADSSILDRQVCKPQ
jgi:archaellum biogenesis protein FlaJ (TadC family)